MAKAFDDACFYQLQFLVVIILFIHGGKNKYQ